MSRAFAEVAFTPNVQAIQKQHGSASSYADFLQPDVDREDHLGPGEMEFIARMDGFFQATISQSGWPYVQFRGGPKGFLKVLDNRTVAYADFRGNRQYLSVGNLTGDNRISLILVDYPNRRRLKIWGRARIVEPQDILTQKLRDPAYRGLVERAVVITIEALDWNCPAHIPQRLTLQEMQPHLDALHNEVERLKAENRQLRASIGSNL
tara:strand:- start:126624 stop:127247 length:624 start_codon:yes stop_codon:yes gene_type:complete